MPDTPKLIPVLATMLLPYRHAIWCAVEGREPYANEIVVKKWGEDGESVVIGLESHHGMRFHRTEMVEVVALPPTDHVKRSQARFAEKERAFWASKPTSAEADLKGLSWKMRDAVTMLREAGWTVTPPKEKP